VIDVFRRKEPPASLARTASWRGQDTRDALHEDFLGKCYLCERKVPAGEFDVEHRVQRADPAGEDLTFEWTNLFPACKSCNSRRERSWPTGGAASPGDGIEKRIIQKFVASEGQEVEFEAVKPEDIQAENTVKELRRIHLGAGRGKRAARALIDAVGCAVMEMHRRQDALQDAEESGDLGAIAEARSALRSIVSRRACFTMLVRSRVRPKYRYLFDVDDRA